MMAQRAVWISVCLLGAAGAAGAQERLSLSDATRRALEKNHAIRIEREAIAAADARQDGAQGAYDRQFRVEADAIHRKDANATLFSGAPEGSLAPTANSFNWSASISQLFKSGGVMTVSATTARENTNNIYYLFRPAYYTSLGVDLQQPLLRNRAIDPARTALRVTALDRDRSGAVLAGQVLQTVSEVEQAYWSLVAARRDRDTRRGTLALAEQQRRDTEVRIEARTVAVSDLAQPTAEVERRRGDLFAAEESVARAERALKQLMLDNRSDSSWSAELVPTDEPAAAPITLDLEAALRDAVRLRPELSELATRTLQHDADIVLARNDLKPQLDLVAGYTMRGLGGGQNEGVVPIGGVNPVVPTPLAGGVGTSWDAAVSQRFPDARVGLVFQMPLGNREARGKLGAAESGRRQTLLAQALTEQRIAVEVRNAATALETAAGRMQAARAGLAAAETQLRAEQDRFGVGTSTNFFVLTRQNDLALAQLADTAALTDYRKALTELARATGTLLRDRGIEMKP